MEEATATAGMDSWPVPVEIHAGNEKLVKLSDLSNSYKVRAWGEIRTNAPALAQLCLLYTSPSPRDVEESRMPSSA